MKCFNHSPCESKAIAVCLLAIAVAFQISACRVPVGGSCTDEENCRVIVDENGDGELSEDLQRAWNELIWENGELRGFETIKFEGPGEGTFHLHDRVSWCADDTARSGSERPDCDGTHPLPKIELTKNWSNAWIEVDLGTTGLEHAHPENCNSAFDNPVIDPPYAEGDPVDPFDVSPECQGSDAPRRFYAWRIGNAFESGMLTSVELKDSLRIADVGDFFGQGTMLISLNFGATLWLDGLSGKVDLHFRDDRTDELRRRWIQPAVIAMEGDLHHRYEEPNFSLDGVLAPGAAKHPELAGNAIFPVGELRIHGYSEGEYGVCDQSWIKEEACGYGAVTNIREEGELVFDSDFQGHDTFKVREARIKKFHFYGYVDNGIDLSQSARPFSLGGGTPDIYLGGWIACRQGAVCVDLGSGGDPGTRAVTLDGFIWNKQSDADEGRTLHQNGFREWSPSKYAKVYLGPNLAYDNPDHDAIFDAGRDTTFEYVSPNALTSVATTPALTSSEHLCLGSDGWVDCAAPETTYIAQTTEWVSHLEVTLQSDLPEECRLSALINGEPIGIAQINACGEADLVDPPVPFVATRYLAVTGNAGETIRHFPNIILSAGDVFQWVGQFGDAGACSSWPAAELTTKIFPLPHVFEGYSGLD